MLELNLKISLLETGLVLLCHLAAVAGSFYTAASNWIQIVSAVIVACSLVIQLNRTCLASRASLLRLSIGQQGSRLCYRHHSRELGLPEPVYISDCLLVLCFPENSDRRSDLPWFRRFNPATSTRVVLFADSLEQEKRRQLRVYLRCGFFSSPESQGGNGQQF